MDFSSAQTRKLVVRAIAGSRSAVEQLLVECRPHLRRMVAVRMDSRLKARLDPSDVVQTVLAEAAHKMVTFQQSPEQFFAWLRQLAWDELARLRRDHIHVQKRSVTREQNEWQGQVADDSMNELAERLAAQQLGPGSRLVHKEIRARVQAALAMLAPADREILVLRFLEHLDLDSAASALGITVAAVKSRQFRAVDRLGNLLRDLQSEDGR
jgi:RNA polymerase sigma-70 factor (ECF subfamily)